MIQPIELHRKHLAQELSPLTMWEGYVSKHVVVLQ